MSKFKLLPNRISKTLPPDALEQMQGAFKILMDLLGDDTPMTDEEYKELSKIPLASNVPKSFIPAGLECSKIFHPNQQQKPSATPLVRVC